MKQDPYDFFLPLAIADKKAAINAIVAGTIAAALLTISSGLVAAVWFVRGVDSPAIDRDILLAATVIFAVVTVGTWKRVLSAAIVGMVMGVILITWLAKSGQIVAAVILAVPSIGGFMTAARGILTLKPHR